MNSVLFYYSIFKGGLDAQSVLTASKDPQPLPYERTKSTASHHYDIASDEKDHGKERVMNSGNSTSFFVKLS